MSTGIGAIFDLRYAIQKTKRVLGYRNNIFLDTYDWRPWILTELDYILSYIPTRTMEDEHKTQMGDVGIPTDILNLAKDTMRKELESMIRQAFGPVRETHHYDCEFLKVDVYGEIYELQVIDQGDYRLLNLPKCPEAENQPYGEYDGYIPERMRY